jgi:hypothetical protein
MSDLVVTSRPLLMWVLTEIRPFVIFKRAHVERGLCLLPLIGDRRMGCEEFLQLAREVDRFAALNHSKTKRIFAADVEQHLRGKGVSTPVTTSSLAQRGDGVRTAIDGPVQSVRTS